jgi:hypothetical protein
MTREDIIRLARECFADPDGSLALLTPELTEFAALVAAAEREACAKVCDVVAKKMYDEGEGTTGYIAWVTDCATAIRARGNK